MKMLNWPDGYGRRVLDTVSSTLDEARRCAGELRGPEWIMARRQTAARGRRGRAWAMPAGNFAATLVLPLAEPPGHAALRSFLASLAVREALVSLTGRETEFGLKWPNDVLLRGGKIAGILLESLGGGGETGHLAIGIGVNLSRAPGREMLEEGALPAVSLRESLGVEIMPEVFLDALAQSYALREAQFRDFGFEPIRRVWLEHALRLGEVIEARMLRESHRGTFVDVDGEGQLVLETPKGRVAIPAADVYF